LGSKANSFKAGEGRGLFWISGIGQSCDVNAVVAGVPNIGGGGGDLVEEMGGLHVDTHGSKHDGKLTLLLLCISLSATTTEITWSGHYRLLAGLNHIVLGKMNWAESKTPSHADAQRCQATIRTPTHVCTGTFRPPMNSPIRAEQTAFGQERVFPLVHSPDKAPLA
jgi:hypothetical protein